MQTELANAPPAERVIDESELVERAKVRSPEAWTEIYDRCYEAIFRYVRARVFDPDTVDDLVSAVFVAAMKGIGSYRYTGRPILAWLYRIARNVVADYQRETMGRNRREHPGGPFQSLGHALKRLVRENRVEEMSAATPWEGDLAAERIDLRGAVASLPEMQREVLTLRFFVGLSTDEIAVALGKERAAIYSLHARAIASLRRTLVDYASGSEEQK